MRTLTLHATWLLAVTVLALSGCAPGRTQRPVTFAVISNVLLADRAAESDKPDAEFDATALDRLKRTVEEINSSNVEFVVLLGNLLARGQPRSLDAAKATLAELKKPYYVALGPEGLAAAVPSPRNGASAAGDIGSAALSASLLTWTFRDHGFSGPTPYWAVERDGGLVLVGLYTSSPGVGRAGHIDAEQLTWLDGVLDRYADKAVVILTYHALVSQHPLDTTPYWEDRLVDNRREVMEVIDRHTNATAVISAAHRFAAGKVVGRVVHFGVPGLSTWPLAYDLVCVRPGEIDRQYIPVGTREESMKAFDRLAADVQVRELFGGSERDEDRIIQTFGGNKSARWNLNALRP